MLTAAAYAASGICALLALREFVRWIRGRGVSPVRLLLFGAVAINLVYSLPRETREALKAARRPDPPPAEAEACAKLLRPLPPSSRVLVLLPEMPLKDRKYLETNLNYRVCPLRPDYAVGDRKVAHDYRDVDRATPGYFDPLQFFRPLGPITHEYVLVGRNGPAPGGYERVDGNEHATLFRRRP